MRNLLILGALALTGCVGGYQNYPTPMTATEQMLHSAALDRVAAAADLRLERGTKVFLDTRFVPSTPTATFFVSRLQAHLQGHGLVVVDRPDAAVIVTPSLAADSIDQIDRVLGVPSMTLPASATGSSLAEPIHTPEISIWSKHQRFGVAQIYLTAVDAKTGALLRALGPLSAKDEVVNRRLFTGFVFGDELAPPEIRAKISR